MFCKDAGFAPPVVVQGWDNPLSAGLTHFFANGERFRTGGSERRETSQTVTDAHGVGAQHWRRYTPRTSDGFQGRPEDIRMRTNSRIGHNICVGNACLRTSRGMWCL